MIDIRKLLLTTQFDTQEIVNWIDQAILYVKVSRDGATLDARIFSPSNDAAFNEQALDLVKMVRWNPAQKNGEPVEAWTQLRVVPVRQP